MLIEINFIEHLQPRARIIRRRFFLQIVALTISVLSISWAGVQGLRWMADQAEHQHEEGQRQRAARVQAAAHVHRSAQIEAQRLTLQSQAAAHRQLAASMPERVIALVVGSGQGIGIEQIELHEHRTRMAGRASGEESVALYLQAEQARAAHGGRARMELTQLRRNAAGQMEFELIGTHETHPGVARE